MKRLSAVFVLFLCVALFADVKAIKRFDFDEMPPEAVGHGALVKGKPGFGQAFKFNGKAYLLFPAIPELVAAEKRGVLTFECWYYREDDDDCGFIMRQNGAFGLLNINWDPTRLNVGVWTAQGYQSFDTEPVLKSGMWTHIGLVFNKLNVKLYVNGKVVIDKNMPAQMNVSSRPFVIGTGINEDNDKPFTSIPGMLDAIEISPIAKGADWAAKIAASTSENFESRQDRIGLPPECNAGKAITTATPLVWKTKNNRLFLENSFYKAEIQLKPSLRIVSIFNKFADAECFGENGTTLFTAHIDGQYLASNNFLTSSYNCEKLENGVKVKAVTEHSYGVRMSVEMTFDDSADMSLNAVMKNLKKQKKVMMGFPVLQNISIGPDFNENYYFWPHLSGWVGKKSYELGMVYGERCWMQFADVFSPACGGGLALSGRDTTGVLKGIITRKTRPNGKIAIDYNQIWEPKRPFDSALKGCGMAFTYKQDTFDVEEEMVIPTAVITVHGGDVLTPIRQYAKWSRKAFKHDPIPDSFKDQFNIVAVHRKAGNAGHVKGFQGDGRMRLADDCEADGRDHQLQVAMWWHYKNPALAGGSGEGDYEYDPTTGGKEGLIRSIREANAMGAQVVLYTCSRQVSNDSFVATKHPEWQFQREPGVGAVDWGSFNPCTHVPEWQDIFISHNVRLLNDLPVAGVYLDTSVEPLRCVSTKHKHARNLSDDVFLFFSKAKKAFRKANPKAFIMTEFMGHEAFAMFTDGCWIQTFANPNAHNFNNYDLDFARFTYPCMHYMEWGQRPDTFEVDSRRAFFNGVGNCRGDLSDEQNMRQADLTNTQREALEALASCEPEPFVPTKAKYLFANFFPSDVQTAWTYYNKGGDQTAILPIPEKYRGKRFVELLSDRVLELKDGALSWNAVQYEVGMIVACEPLLQLAKKGDDFEIVVNGALPDGARLFVVSEGERDSKDNRRELSLKNGKATVPATKGRSIVKVLKGEMLLDEIVF